VIDPYPMTIRRADGRVIVEDVRGDAWSGSIDVSGQFRAPLLTEKIVGIVLGGLLFVPVAIRFRTWWLSDRGSDTKDTMNTEEKARTV
jgi:hypothetical protein